MKVQRRRCESCAHPLAQREVGPGAQAPDGVRRGRGVGAEEHQVAVRVAQQHAERRELAGVAHAVGVAQLDGRGARIGALRLRLARQQPEHQQPEQQAERRKKSGFGRDGAGATLGARHRHTRRVPMPGGRSSPPPERPAGLLGFRLRRSRRPGGVKRACHDGHVVNVAVS